MSVWTVIHRYRSHWNVICSNISNFRILITLFAWVIQQILTNLYPINFFNWLISVHYNPYVTFFIHQWLSSLESLFKIWAIYWLFTRSNIRDTSVLLGLSFDITHRWNLLLINIRVILWIIISKVWMLIRSIKGSYWLIVYSRIVLSMSWTHRM